MENLQNKILLFIHMHSNQILGIFGFMTLLVCFAPLVFEDPGDASLDPKKEAYKVQQRINEKFIESVQFVSFVIEADDGDMVNKKNLSQLLINQNKIISKDSKQELAVGTLKPDSFLWEGYDEETRISFTGIYSFANAVDDALKNNPNFPNGLQDADGDDVKIMLHYLFNSGLVGDPYSVLSKGSKSEVKIIKGQEINFWTSPALFIEVLSDNSRLGGGNFAIELGGDETSINKELYGRNIESLLNEDSPSFKALGIAMDVNTTAEEQGATAGPFITATVIAAIAVCGIFLRSYVAMVLVGVGLISLMIWLKGMSFVLGFKGGLITDLIVPIAMVSLGVDFAIHALRRIQEERSNGHKNYFIVGMSGVLGALTLALLTDSSAFLANTFAGVESVFYFGIAATFATLLSYIVLGVLVPVAYAKIMPLIKNKRTKKESFIRVINFITTPASCGFGVIFVVILGSTLLNDFLGLLIGFITSIFIIIVNLIIPIIINQRSNAGKENQSISQSSGFEKFFAKTITNISKRYYFVLPVSLVVTIIAAYGALNLKSEFDVKDFFDNESNFVIALDKLEEYDPGSRGEPAQFIFEGEITDPDFMVIYNKFIRDLSKIDFIGTDENGELNQNDTLNLGKISSLVLANEKIKENIFNRSGILITDDNNDGILDRPEQLKEVIVYGIENGLESEGKYLFDPLWFQRYFWYNKTNDDDFTSILLVFLAGTRTEDDVSKVRKELDILVANAGFPNNVSVGITGSPFSRSDQLNATTNSMRRSIPIAFVASFIIILLALKSFRYAVATIIPIALVVVWLYGIMYLFNFSLNYVTATIGAISLGVGVDFSIHMTMRFREELFKSKNKLKALYQSINGTGLALLGSAISSVLGFIIMGLAPMPLFSTFGILTAIMICLALISSLLTLPSILFLIAKEK